MCKLASVCTQTNTLFIMLPDKKKPLHFVSVRVESSILYFFFELCTTGRLLYKGDNKNDINPFCPDAYSPLHVHFKQLRGDLTFAQAVPTLMKCRI